MDDENKVTPDVEEMSDESRRDFLNKLLVGVGGVAAAGLLASALGSHAEAAPMGTLDVARDIRGTPLRETPLQYRALNNGHALSASSPALTQTLLREGLLNPAKVGQNVASVGLSLTYG